MRNELALALLVLGACNRMLGIDDVVRDTDGDGRLDDVDNCPEVFNPFQFDVCPCETTGVDADEDLVDDGCDECVGPGPMFVDSGGNGIDDGCEPCPAATGIDADQDGVDDACDVCPVGASHDEDHDGVEDGCDVCPGIADAQRIDLDADFIGDVCDPLGTAEVVQIFDPFLTLAAHWDPLPAGWSVSDDALVISTVAARVQLLATTDVPLRTSIETRWIGAGPGAAGIVIAGPTQRLTCTIDEKGVLQIDLTPPTTTQTIQLPEGEPSRLRLHTQPLPNSELAYVCSVLFDNGDVMGVQLDGLSGLLGRPGLVSSGVGSFEYYWQLTTLD